MQARRGTALLLSCVLALLLVAPVHAAAQPEHAGHGVALLAPAGAEPPHSWRSAPDHAVQAHAVVELGSSVRTGSAVSARQLTSYDTPALHVRGPPGSLA